MDIWEADSISDIARTEGFDLLIRALEDMYKHHADMLITMSGNRDIEEIRHQAGRLSGLVMAINRMRQAREKVKNVSA